MVCSLVLKFCLPCTRDQRQQPADWHQVSRRQPILVRITGHSAETAELRAVITELRVQVEALQSELDKERQRSRDEFERGLNFNLKKGKKRRHTDSDS